MRYSYQVVWPKVMLLLLGVAGVACAADKLADELGDEFLEYLGSLEGTDDDWTDFVAATAASSSSAASSKPAALAKASSSTSSAGSVKSKAAVINSSKAER